MTGGGALVRPPLHPYHCPMKTILWDIWDTAIGGIMVNALLMYMWFSIVAGVVAVTVDVTQYFRYSQAFPADDFTLVAVAGAFGLLMTLFSLLGGLALRKRRIGRFTLFLGISAACAFAIAFIPRVRLGTALKPDLFSYIGGIGVLGILLLLITAPGRAT